jgi:hypothetical protein
MFPLIELTVSRIYLKNEWFQRARKFFSDKLLRSYLSPQSIIEQHHVKALFPHSSIVKYGFVKGSLHSLGVHPLFGDAIFIQASSGYFIFYSLY